MLKKIFVLLTIILIMTFSLAYASKVTQITYDGETHDYTGPDLTLVLNDDVFEVPEGLMNPIILDDRTLVPVREVFETLGGTVNWDDGERRVDVSLDSTNISLWIDNKETLVNNQKVSLDVPAKIINDKTMVPVRFISEQAGLKVDWEDETKTVSIMYPKTTIDKVTVKTLNNTKCIVVSLSKPVTKYKYYSVEQDETMPNRLVIDIRNSDFNIDIAPMVLQDEDISQLRFGIQENQVSRIAIDLKEEVDSYTVALSKDRKTLYYAFDENFSVENIVETKQEENEVKPSDDTPTIEPSGEVKSPSGEDQEKIIDIVSGENIIINEKSGDNTNHVNFAEITKSGESTNEKSSGNSIESGENKSSGENQDDKIDLKEESGNKEVGENLVINIIDEDETLAQLVENDEPVLYSSKIESIKYSAQTGRVKIKYSGKLNYDISELTDPYRVVIDIAEAQLNTSGPTQISPKNSLITSIRFSQYTKAIVRVVIELNKKCDSKAYERTGELQIEVVESTYKNIKYKQNSSNAQITLSKVEVSDFTTEVSDDRLTYKLKYQGEDNFFGEGTITPEDRFVDNITVKDNVIVVSAVDMMSFTIRKSLKTVVVTIRALSDEEIAALNAPPSEDVTEEDSGDEEEEDTKKSKDMYKILIDVGHGGTDPGACNGDYQEKVYNLAIAKELYNLLAERDDITVYMDRKDNDTYLNREDRVAYATKIKPDFIISVHNNSLENKMYSGTMVLYYNNDTESDYGDITSKECAEIVLNNLVDSLGTINRGVVSRPDLHILSKTPCPSILCEVCFISNDEEVARLKTKSFQTSAAKAMYEGVLEIIKDLH